MGLGVRFSTITLLVVSLSACSTIDALTPQIGIGSGSQDASSRVTQDDTERMAGTPAPTQTDDLTRTATYATGPQNTLEAQARALEGGSTMSPSSSGPPPDLQGQSAGSRSAAGESNGSMQASAGVQPAAGSTAGTIRFLPIIGAPVGAVTPLSRQLGAEARAGGLVIRPSSDAATEHILKGYFSAFANDDKVTVIYVWDILDPSGARLNRMQGQETIAANGSDPWAAVPDSVMQSIASKTIQDYLSWRQSRSG